MAHQWASIDGITDLTTTEGRLRNFSRICKHVFRIHEYHQLLETIKSDPYIRRRSEKVINRHLKILEKWRIIRYQNSGYYLDDNGEVLYNIVKDIEDSKEELDLMEKIFYFITMFTGVTFAQLSLFLRTIDKEEGQKKNEIMVKYFKLFLRIQTKLWMRSSIEECLTKYRKSGHFPRSYENKFDTMKMWLEELGLIKGLSITRIGRKILNEIDPNDELLSKINILQKRTVHNIYKLARFFLKNCITIEFNYASKDHWELFIKIFKEAYMRFLRPTLGFSNIRSIRRWVPLRLLVDYGIIFEETEFDSFLYKLRRRGIVKSLILGDDGKVAFVRLN